MWEASASSARFRAAAAIESRGSSNPPPPPIERTGEHATYAEEMRDTRHDDRLTMIASVIADVFGVLSPVLSTVPSSARARDLIARAERYASLVSQWEVAAPGHDEQIGLFEEASRLHADALALVAAHRRSPRVAR